LPLIVQKFGGSSVSDAEKIKHVAQRVLQTQAEGNQVCVVVSAMGDTTDELIDLADSVTTDVTGSREMDILLTAGERISMSLLALAIRELGGKAMSFTGFQAGISTDSEHGSARIWKIDPKRIQEAMADGNIAVVAGFQGFSFENGDTTTLGRGGSDTTAVALAAAMNADICEIYSDVDGVYTADPRVVPRARKLAQIDLDSMLELSSSGAKILYIRAVEFARRHAVPLRVRSTFSADPGTLVYTSKPGEEMEEPIVSGVATDDTQSKITVVGVPDRPGKAAEIFQIVAEAGANIDMIVQNVSTTENHLSDISFTLPHSDRPKVVDALKARQSDVGFASVSYDDEIGKLSIVGAGMKTSSGVSAKLFGALAKAGINIEMISTSEIRISVITRADQLKEATRVVHTAFELDAADTAVVYAGTGR
jgi:aspartate kinase